jgi:hypothetical protein
MEEKKDEKNVWCLQICAEKVEKVACPLLFLTIQGYGVKIKTRAV